MVKENLAKLIFGYSVRCYQLIYLFRSGNSSFVVIQLNILSLISNKELLNRLNSMHACGVLGVGTLNPHVQPDGKYSMSTGKYTNDHDM